LYEHAYGGQGLECGGLIMLGPGSDTVRRGGLGINVALLEKVCNIAGKLLNPSPTCSEASFLLFAFRTTCRTLSSNRAMPARTWPFFVAMMVMD